MLKRIHVVALLLGLMSVGMLVPMLQAVTEGEWRSARGFLYPAIAGFFMAGGFGVLLRPLGTRESAQKELLTLLVVWLALPVFAAVPLVLLTPSIGVIGAWFEMVAALTTTGGTVYLQASAAPDAIQLWRGMVGWQGGLLTLMAAYVVLAPRRMGGYEILAAADGIAEARSVDMRAARASLDSRASRAFRTIIPIYAGMTGVLALAFSAFGKPGLVATVHAMSVVSTSGISPIDGGFGAQGSIWVEVIAVIFMVLATTRLLYAPAAQTGSRTGWREDPELRLMLGLGVLAIVALYARHWVGVLNDEVEFTMLDGLRALWGDIFSTVSYLTTTGFESYALDTARSWAGLDNPGILLLCLCAIGGGAATTAGGIKLIRAWALLRHGVRELERIASPNSVAGSGRGARSLRREGAIIAWAFMMLFFLVLLTALLGLTGSGMRFADALVAAVAALSNTGPAYALAAQQPAGFAILSEVQHVILGIVMTLGRIETLAVIALFNPDLWRIDRKREKNDWKIQH